VTRKLAFMLATCVMFGTVPLTAHESCSGSACNSFSVEGKNYSTSEKRAKAVFINKDKSRGIRLKGCVLEAGKCGRSFVLEIDPGLKSQVSEPAATQSAILNINIANFLPQQGSGPPVTPRQCQKQCTGNDTSAERANCLKKCPQATASPPSGAEFFKISGASLEPAGWDELDSWTRDDHASAFATFQASCRPIVRSQSSNDMRPVHTALQTVCARAVKAGPLDTEASRYFFEANSADSHPQAGRRCWFPDRLLRADCRRLTVSHPGIYGSALPPAAGPAGSRSNPAGWTVSQHRTSVSQDVERSARALLRSRRGR
jgi:hypothetical protein